MGHLERLQARSPQWFVDKLPDGVHITVKDLCPSHVHPEFYLLLSQTLPTPESCSSRYSAPLQCVQTCIFFAPVICWKSFSGPTPKALLCVDDCMRQCSPGIPRPQPRGAGDSSWATTGSTAGTEVCMPITRCTERRDCSQFPWSVVVYTTAPTKALRSMVNAKLLLREGYDEECLILPCS